MSRLSPPPITNINLKRSQSPVSIAASDTTYHSFHDVELFEPSSPPVTTGQTGQTRPTVKTAPTTSVNRPKIENNNLFDPLQPFAAHKDNNDQSEPKKNIITRQDSGYESAYSGSRSGASQSSSSHGGSSSSRSTPQQIRLHQRPGVPPKRSSASAPAAVSYTRRHNSVHSLHLTPSHPRHQAINSYYHFPSLESISGQKEEEGKEAGETSPSIHHPLTQPEIKYWMSDQTRRREYAAIDAANRGVKGWVMRYMVPDCFVPKDHRRLTFDDDSGSVRRYRLELKGDDSDAVKGKGERKKRKLGCLLGR